MALMIWSVRDLREVIEGCINNKFDAIVFIEGNRGLGKSTLAWKIVSGLNIPIPFRPKRDIVFTREDVLKHLSTKKGGVIWADELVNISYNRDFYQEEQKTLLKALMMFRDASNIFIGCIPKFVELDNQIKRLCKIRITVVRRGLALIQTQMPSIYIADGWDIRNNQKIESKWTLRRGSKPKYAQLTTVRGILKFGDLSPHQREEYEKIKEEKRGRVFSEYQDVTLLGNPEKVFYQNLLEQVVAGKITNDMLETIASINGRDKEKVRNKLNNLLKEKGDKNRVRDYVMPKDKKERKDKLGFVIKSSEQAFSMPEIVPARMVDKNELPMQEPVINGAVEEEKKEHKKIMTPLLNDEDEQALTQDIFGFKG